MTFHTRLRPKSGLGQAAGYLQGQWTTLARHVEHGQTRLDHNLVENAVRPTAVGRENWLFVGHPEAGQRSAILYSVIVSCLRHIVVVTTKRHHDSNRQRGHREDAYGQ